MRNDSGRTDTVEVGGEPTLKRHPRVGGHTCSDAKGRIGGVYERTTGGGTDNANNEYTPLGGEGPIDMDNETKQLAPEGRHGRTDIHTGIWGGAPPGPGARGARGGGGLTPMLQRGRRMHECYTGPRPKGMHYTTGRDRTGYTAVGYSGSGSPGGGRGSTGGMGREDAWGMLGPEKARRPHLLPLAHRVPN